MTIKIKENIPFYLSITAIVLLFFIVEYNLFSKEFYALSADESGHTLEAYDWYKNDAQLFSIWLPFYKIVNGIALNLHYNLFITPRIMSAIFGLLTLLSMIFLTHQLFENKIIALLAGFLATIFLPIAVFSILPLSEIFFFFFIISSIGCFLLWLKNSKNSFLWLTIFFLSIGTSTRYESWIFALFIFILIVFQVYKSRRSTSKKTILIAFIAVIISAFPIYWIYLSLIANQNVHGFISSVSNRYSEGKIISEIKNNVLYQFLIINITTLNIIGFASLIPLIKSNSNAKKYSIIFFGTLITFAILSFTIKAMPTHNYWRIAMIWSLLLLPFTAYWIYHLLETSNSFPMHKYGFIIFFILLIYFFNLQLGQYTAHSYLTGEDIKIGKFLNQIANEDSSKIYVMKDGSDKWRYSNFLITSQKPGLFVLELNNFTYTSADTILIDQKLVTEMRNREIKFILIPSKITLGNGSEYFSEIKTFEQWKVYKMFQQKKN